MTEPQQTPISTPINATPVSPKPLMNPLLVRFMLGFTVIAIIATVALVYTVITKYKTNNPAKTDNAVINTSTPTVTATVTLTTDPTITPTISITSAQLTDTPTSLTTATVTSNPVAPTARPTTTSIPTRTPVPTNAPAPINTPTPVAQLRQTYNIYNHSSNPNIIVLSTLNSTSMATFYGMCNSSGMCTSVSPNWMCTTSIPSFCNAEINLGDGGYAITINTSSSDYVNSSTNFKLCTIAGTDGICKK